MKPILRMLRAKPAVIFAIAAALTAGGILIAQEAGRGSGGQGLDGLRPFRSELPIPELREGVRDADGTVRIPLRIREGEVRFLGSTPTPTIGYDGDYLGPTIRVRKGDRVRMMVENGLDEPTTVHWHGLRVPAEADGGPHQVIAAGGTWSPEFPIIQEAATLWYHPHLMGATAEQVYRGLAGMFIIDDENSDSLGLPSEYGVDDIPLVLQDRRFYQDGTFAYEPTMHDFMAGFQGNALLVNGALAPRKEVPGGLVRLRILNGSNGSVFRLTLSDGSPFRVIASDGGFLEKPLERDELILSAGERIDVLADFSRMQRGDQIYLVTEIYQGPTFRAVRFDIGSGARRGGSAEQTGGGSVVAERLNRIEPFPEAEAKRVRPFVMSTGMGGVMLINGRRMDMMRVDERVPLGETEIWEISNRGMGMMSVPHSFHVHGTQFQVLTLNGAAPPPVLGGWKDTVLLWPGDVVRIIVRFDDYTGLYMYHCHVLEHEDSGMMGQFEVIRKE